MASTVTIPFGCVDGITAKGSDYDVSIGKLFAGGQSIFLFSQNKVKKTSVSKTKYSSCADWIVVGVTDDGATGGDNPLESASASYQEDTNIIWAPVSPGTTPTEISAGDNVNDVAPATKCDCIVFLGYNANYTVSVKGKSGVCTSFEPDTLFSALGATSVPAAPAWSRGESLTMQRTDWQVVSSTGKGYVVVSTGATSSPLSESATAVDATLTATGKVYFQVSYSANARGDCTSSATKFEILEA